MMSHYLKQQWQNGPHFVENIFKSISLNEMFCIFIKISLKFAPKGLTENKAALVQVMAWHRQAIIWTNVHPVLWRI